VSINNFPYVAWSDTDGTHSNARVARLDTSTFPAPTWKQEAAGVTSADGRIVQSTTDGVASVSVASVTAGPNGVGVPYVAWVEYQSVGPNKVFELRAARFDSANHLWQQAWPGASPSFGGIGETGTTNERFPDLASVGGVPYLSRQLYPSGGLRISRLEPEITSESAAPGANGETFSATAHTYGISYPFGFQYGPALDTQTSAQPATAGSDTVTVSRSVGALRPNTTYEYRAFATAGAPAPLVLGPTLTLRTNAAGTGTSSGTGSSSANLASVLRERLKPSRFRAAPSGPSARSAAKAKYGTMVTFTLDRKSTLTFTVSKRRKKLHGSFSRRGRAGVNKFRFTGRLAHKRLAPGRYVLTATPVSGRLKGPSRSVSFRIVR
jgi:hypothetical protein